MHALTFLLVLAIAAHKAASSAPTNCGPNEVPGDSCKNPETFCQATAPELPTCGGCVCKEGFVRTAFRECVSREDCDKCRGRASEDFMTCGTVCPHVCNVTVPDFCTKQCVGKCFCLPGYVRSSPDGPCVPWETCPPLCKENMGYTGCLSNCPAVCNQTETRFCTQQCRRAGCACDEGFLLDPIKVNACVPKSQCTNSS